MRLPRVEHILIRPDKSCAVNRQLPHGAHAAEPAIGYLRLFAPETNVRVNRNVELPNHAAATFPPPVLESLDRG